MTEFLILLATVIVVGLFVWLKRRHEVLVTALHAAFDQEVKALRAEVAGLQLTQRGGNGR